MEKRQRKISQWIDDVVYWLNGLKWTVNNHGPIIIQRMMGSPHEDPDTCEERSALGETRTGDNKIINSHATHSTCDDLKTLHSLLVRGVPLHYLHQPITILHVIAMWRYASDQQIKKLSHVEGHHCRRRCGRNKLLFRSSGNPIFLVQAVKENKEATAMR